MKTLIIGAAIIDKMLKLDSLPQAGEDILAEDLGMVVGGCAYNVASTLDNLGGDFDLFVPVGEGPNAEIIKKGLTERGFTALINDKSQDNGYCLSIIDKTGERTFITVNGLEGSFNEAWFDEIDLSAYANVYMAGYEVLGEAGKIITAKLADYKGDIFFAPGPMIMEIEKSTMEAFFSLGAILHLNHDEALKYTGLTDINEAIKALYDKTHALVVITLGADGAMYYRGDEINIIPTNPVEVVDTVGAGDSHIGGLIYALNSGYDLHDAVVIANTVSGLIVSQRGPVLTNEEFNILFNILKEKIINGKN